LEPLGRSWSHFHFEPVPNGPFRYRTRNVKPHPSADFQSCFENPFSEIGLDIFSINFRDEYGIPPRRALRGNSDFTNAARNFKRPKWSRNGPLWPFQACGAAAADLRGGIYSGKPTEGLIQGVPRPEAAPWADSPLVPTAFEGVLGEVGLPPTGAVGGWWWFCSAESPWIRLLDFWQQVRGASSNAAADAPGCPGVWDC